MFPRLVLVSLLSLTWTTVTGLPCTEMFPSPSPPSTVNSVRPSDVSVLSSVALHMHSTDLSTVVSRLGELLSLFNPALISPPAEETNLYSTQFVQQRTLVQQAKDVSLYLHNNKLADAGRDWKLVILFVQVDQLCVFKQQQQVQAVTQAVVEDVDEALQMLHSQLRRTIVSVALWDGEHNTFQSKKHSCMELDGEGEARLLRAVLIHSLQESLGELLARRSWYGDKEDFTVTLQDRPLIADSSVVSGKLLSESETAQQTDKLLVQLWTNLLQSTDDKSDEGNIFTLPCPTEGQPFLRTEGNLPSYNHGSVSTSLHPSTGTAMPCKDFSPSDTTPTSVHELRPADIKVVAALGDSLTAGNGIASSQNNLLDVLSQYRGLSWSIGGDGNLTTVTTLPNILKYFNHNLTGFSVGAGKEHTDQAFLNQAFPGAKAKDMPSQVRALVAKMKNDTRIDFANDWKVITIFIGANDLCDHCANSLLYSAENYGRYISESLDYLQKEVPRALVNFVEALYLLPLRELHFDKSLKCPTWLVTMLCPCVLLPVDNSKAFQMVEDLTRKYQRILHKAVESGRYDTRSDFTVVIQPFFRDITVPRLPDGRFDRSYFSADCFHLSQKAHTQISRSLWNNMLEPLGNKTSNKDFNVDLDLKCPTKTSPYIRTFKNSNYVYAGPSPTPGPPTNWGSDFSCVDLSPSQTVPTSVHQLRPADIVVVAALGDSVTAATGAKAKTVFDLSKNYPEVSWSIGGEKSLETITTLPNILKKFNPALKGFSKGSLPRQKGFNMAKPGAQTSDILAQVQDLIKAMKENKEVNFDQDWKLVTIFVGGKDLCRYCTDQNNLSPKNYSHNLMLSLDMLYREVPRLLVNVVEILQIHPLKTVKRSTLPCALIPRGRCPCVINAAQNSPELAEIKRINLGYQVEIQHLISSDRYDGKEDFAVVLQPFLHDSFIPHIGTGEPDTSFFSVDCLHISERAHSEMAIALWNNMLEPVGKKQAYNNFTHNRSKVNCPSEASPFIYTKLNSLPTRPTTPIPTSSSPLSALPVTSCPSFLPVWVPVVVGIVSLLAGVTVAWLLFSCSQRRKNKAEEGIEMTGTGF